MAGTGPSALGTDPAGKFAYVVNNSDNDVSSFKIDPAAGGLTPTAGSPVAAGSNPNFIGVHLWLFFHLNPATYPVFSRIALGVHVAACIGPFWMLYDWFIKNQKGELKRWMWLVFVPWGFLWYYFEVHRAMISRTKSREA